MTRNQKIRTLMSGCALIVLAAVIIAVSGMFNGPGSSYANAEKYAVGETDISGAVKHLSIEWMDGAVRVEYHAQGTILLRETSTKALSEDQKLRWWLDGDTLRVQYARSGLRLNFDLNKQLTVTLQEGIVLDDAKIHTTSGDVFIPQLTANQLDLQSTSGDLQAVAAIKFLCASSTSGDQRLQLTAGADSVKVHSTSGSAQVILAGTASLEAETTSGGFSFTGTGKTDRITVNSTSGNVYITAEEAGLVKVDSSSGTIAAQLTVAGKVELGSTSGSVSLQAGKAEEIKISSTSGDVTAALPEIPGFTARLDTTSGSVNTGLALTKAGKTYACGDGSGQVTISTTSGNIRLEAWQN